MTLPDAPPIIHGPSISFRNGVVSICYEKRNIPIAFHHCTPDPWRHKKPPQMNTRFNSRLTVDAIILARLFCPACGFAVEFDWSQDMPCDRIEEQLRQSARWSWPALNA